MQLVEALQSFDHGGLRKKNKRFSVSDPAAKELVKARLVRIIDQRPTVAVGKKLSASPAAQVSQQTTAKKSGAGATRRRKPVASSSQIPLTE